MKGNCTKLHRWEGTGLELIKGRVSITDPERSRETIEKDLLLDCDASGGSGTQQKSPGTEMIGDLQVEVIYNPVVPDDTETPEITNDHNHHLFEDDFDNETATFWLIEYPNSEGTGIWVHAFVQNLSAVEVTPNEDVKRTFTLVPTGVSGGYIKVNDAANYALGPDAPDAPVDYYSA